MCAEIRLPTLFRLPIVRIPEQGRRLVPQQGRIIPLEPCSSAVADLVVDLQEAFLLFAVLLPAVVESHEDALGLE